MKIKLWTKYNVGYVPPKCRKMRYKEEEEYIDVDVKEISKTDLIPAFDTGNIIYSYNSKLWREASESDIHCVYPENKPMTALEALIYSGVTYSTYFGKYEGYTFDESTREQREDVIARAERDMSDYLIVDGILYTVTYEPMYCINTYGLGHNHAGIGTSLYITNGYNSNISKERYFNALDYNKALSKALEIATRRGDTDSLEYIKNEPQIIVFDNKLVTRNPEKDHGEGNSLLNMFESITESSNSAAEAGLLVMCAASITK